MKKRPLNIDVSQSRNEKKLYGVPVKLQMMLFGIKKNIFSLLPLTILVCVDIRFIKSKIL